ncbi:hypothetical protein BY458DRAFT_544784 [Sporodiniella umbellata]|nr:hypothetical protein BY458DRAFT_544784 [Sporodiniella umbellata]
MANYEAIPRILFFLEKANTKLVMYPYYTIALCNVLSLVIINFNHLSIIWLLAFLYSP